MGQKSIFYFALIFLFFNSFAHSQVYIDSGSHSVFNNISTWTNVLGGPPPGSATVWNNATILQNYNTLSITSNSNVFLTNSNFSVLNNILYIGDNSAFGIPTSTSLNALKGTNINISSNSNARIIISSAVTPFVHDSSLINGSTLDHAPTITNNSILQLDSVNFFNSSTSLLDNYGTVVNNKTIVGTGNGNNIVNNEFGATLNNTNLAQMSGVSLSNNGTLINSGSINSLNGLSNLGTIINQGTISHSLGFNNQGTYKTDSTGVFNGPFTNQGIVISNGTFNGSFNNLGTVIPGDAPGLMAVNGDYTESNKLQIDIAGSNPVVNGAAGNDGGVQYGVLRIIGDLNLGLNSVLSANFWNNYTPPLGTIFDIVDYTGTLTGFFGTLPGGLWNIAYHQSSFNTYTDTSLEFKAIYLCYGSCQSSAVPEPETYLVLSGCLGLVFFLRQIRKLAF